MSETMVLTETAWLLQNRLNPFPVAGRLDFDGVSLSFSLTPLAAGAALGWVESRLGRSDLGAVLSDGIEVEAFRAPRADLAITWPRLFAGSALEVTDGDDQRWLISLDYPSGGSIGKTLSLISGRRKGRIWQAALGG